MGRVYKRGTVYWGYWRDARGKGTRGTLATSDRAVAVERLRQRELDPRPRAANGRTLGAALRYLLETVYAGRSPGTLHCYGVKSVALLRLLGPDTPVDQIAREDVLRYRANRLAEGTAETTVAKELIVLRLALREQRIEGVVPRMPARSEPRTRHLAYDEALALLEELAPARRVWLMVAVYGGLRASELRLLEWEDIDLERGWIRVRGRKTRRSDRPVPIAAALRSWLEAWAQDAPQGPVLEPWLNGRRDLARACERAGQRVGTARIGVRVARASANDLRRTFASWLVQGGASTLAVAHLLGHSSTRMVEQVYGRLTPAVYVDALAALPGCTAGVHAGGTSLAQRDAADAAVEDESPIVLVPRDGIEPPTRGFSGPRRLVAVR